MVKADQLGSATIAPASITQTVLLTGTPQGAKKIPTTMVSCIKNGKSKKVIGSKCPTGYSMKKVKKGN
jgi:hypothetical protein